MRSTSCILVAVSVPAFMAGQTPVLTGGYDLARTNADVSETVLTPSTVNANGFGRQFTLPADGQIWTQPLYLPNVNMPGQGAHNVIYFGTAHNTVYAYDADNAGTPLWSVNLGPSIPSSAFGLGYTDVTPEIGILGTPVIDPSSGTLYVVAGTLENGTFFYRLHALDTATGAEKFGAPVVIQATVAGNGADSVDGQVSFNAAAHLQRPALLLVNGVVYAAFGSHGDGGIWHGWIMGYSAANVQVQTAVFNATPNGFGGSFWHSGRGLSADAQGNIYGVTGNGTTDETSDFSENVVKLNPSDLSVIDWFAPSDAQLLNDVDADLGSTGAVLLPGNLLLTGGKQGLMYLLNTESLGHMTSNNAQIPQSFSVSPDGTFNMAVWNRSSGPVFYVLNDDAPLYEWASEGGGFNPNPVSASVNGYTKSYDGITVSANGGSPGSGIVWMTTADTWPLPSAGTLHAFDADDLNVELWNSSMNIGRDAMGYFTKFANPTVANGKVYVPTNSGALAVYGLLQPDTSYTPVVTGVVNGASYASGSVAPGEIVTIFGENLGPQALAQGTFGSNGNLSAGIEGTEVMFGGVAAPLLYASEFVIGAIVPFEVSGSEQTTVEVTADGGNSAPQTLSVAPTAPAIFTDDSSGNGEAAVLNEDYSLNTANNPAAPGSVVILYATGGGQTTPAQLTGSTGSAALLLASVTATIGGQPAQVQYAGQAGGEVAGVVQVNLQVPDGVSGQVPVVLTIGGVASQATATIAVQ